MHNEQDMNRPGVPKHFRHYDKSKIGFCATGSNKMYLYYLVMFLLK